MFTGSAVALVTPFKDGSVDYPALEKLIDFHIAGGTECVLVCGTTGESSTQTHDEHKKVIKYSVDYIKSKRGANKFPLLMAGTGSNNTAEALDLTAYAKEAGADCALQVTPYYNKPIQRGLLEHFRTLARQVDIPQVVYNIQSRCGVNVSTEVMVELAAEPNIVGVKEASGNIGQMGDVIRRCPDDFYVWSGDDGMTLPLLALGGRGVISVVANIAPKETSQMVHDFIEGRVAEARAMH
ncbi:MAG: 4-hydroxy-tetrahydrodipicolinate synthase, partial [bacterium]